MIYQLRFASEIVPRTELPMPSLQQVAPQQVDVAVRLVERYDTPFYIEDYRNEQLDKLNELIGRKAKGLKPRIQPRADKHATAEGDITKALRATLGAEAGQLPA